MAEIQNPNDPNLKRELVREFVSDDGRLTLEVLFCKVKGRAGSYQTATLTGIVTDAPGDYMPHRVLEDAILRDFVNARLFDDYNQWFHPGSKVSIHADDWNA